MKFTIACVILLQSIGIASSTPEGVMPAERFHSRDVIKRAGRNCGTFTMACDRAGNACNNACYHINCQPGGAASRTMVLVDPNHDETLCIGLTLVGLDMTVPTATLGTVRSPDVKQQMEGVYAIADHLVKPFTIRRTTYPETKASTATSGRWQLLSRVTLHRQQSGTLFDASTRVRTVVSLTDISPYRNLLIVPDFYFRWWIAAPSIHPR